MGLETRNEAPEQQQEVEQNQEQETTEQETPEVSDSDVEDVDADEEDLDSPKRIGEQDQSLSSEKEDDFSDVPKEERSDSSDSEIPEVEEVPSDNSEDVLNEVESQTDASEKSAEDADGFKDDDLDDSVKPTQETKDVDSSSEESAEDIDDEDVFEDVDENHDKVSDSEHQDNKEDSDDFSEPSKEVEDGEIKVDHDRSEIIKEETGGANENFIDESESGDRTQNEEGKEMNEDDNISKLDGATDKDESDINDKLQEEESVVNENDGKGTDTTDPRLDEGQHENSSIETTPQEEKNTQDYSGQEQNRRNTPETSPSVEQADESVITETVAPILSETPETHNHDNWERKPNEELYQEKKEVFDNPKYFDQETGEIHYPPNEGFKGEPEVVTLPEGYQIDRYGRETGYFVAPAGTPFEQRSLDPYASQTEYHRYEVVKPIEGVKSGEIAPWFDEPGGGEQHILNDSIEDLCDEGYLKRI